MRGKHTHTPAHKWCNCGGSRFGSTPPLPQPHSSTLIIFTDAMCVRCDYVLWYVCVSNFSMCSEIYAHYWRRKMSYCCCCCLLFILDTDTFGRAARSVRVFGWKPFSQSLVTIYLPPSHISTISDFGAAPVSHSHNAFERSFSAKLFPGLELLFFLFFFFAVFRHKNCHDTW